MSREYVDRNDPYLQAAIGELKERITKRFPTAQFSVTQGIGDDLEGIYLTTTVDADDPDEVLDVVMDRLLTFEVDQGLPLYVLPVRTPERIAADMSSRTSRNCVSGTQL